MVQLTAPLTKRQLASLQTRKSLKRRLQAPMSRDYGRATQIEQLEQELSQLEIAKHQEATL